VDPKDLCAKCYYCCLLMLLLPMLLLLLLLLCMVHIYLAEARKYGFEIKTGSRCFLRQPLEMNKYWVEIYLKNIKYKYSTTIMYIFLQIPWSWEWRLCWLHIGFTKRYLQAEHSFGKCINSVVKPIRLGSSFKLRYLPPLRLLLVGWLTPSKHVCASQCVV